MHGNHRPPRRRPVLILTSSMLTDRMLQYSRALETISEQLPVVVWALSADHPVAGPVWATRPAAVEPFPAVREYRELPCNLLRRINDDAWDFGADRRSRLSMYKHVRSKVSTPASRARRRFGRALAAVGMHRPLETGLEQVLLRDRRSVEAEERLRELDPCLVVSMNAPFAVEPGVTIAARRLGIPVVGAVPSWDNVTTKHRLVLRHDAYIVWSEQLARELGELYPRASDAPVHIVGAPQFDVFSDPRFEEPREAFCARHGLRADRPIVTYALGSPNFFAEDHGALEFARRVVAGELGDIQVLVRPHPLFDFTELDEKFAGLGPQVVVQGVHHLVQDVDATRDWVSTFRWSDVVVNLSSTVTVDASLFDRPVVNLDFDPEPGAPQQQLVKDVNHLWAHFKPIAESGGVWLAQTMDDVVVGVETYLRRPELHREGRKAIVRHVCGESDGRAGERFGRAVLTEAARHGADTRVAAERA
jgi:hypothetical protein